MINYIYYDQFIPYTCFCADHLDRLFLGGYSHIMQIDTCCNNLNWFTYQIGRIHTMYPLPAGLLIAGNVYNEDDQVFICKLNDSLEIEQQSWFGSEHYEDVVFDALAFPSGELAFCGRSNRAGAWFQIMDTDFNIRDTLFTWGEGIAEFYRIAPVSYYDVILYGWTTPGWEYPDKKIMLTRLTVPLQIKTDDQSRSFEFQLLAAYPNPFNSSVSICLSLTEPQSFEILLNDWLGRRIFRTQLEYSAGSHIYTLPQEISSSLPSGQYALNLNGINRREALFLVKIK